jgi:uncharacterized protein YkwD
VTSVPAAAPLRLALVAALAASFVAFLVAGRAEGAGAGSWRAYLAPATVCPGATDRTASPAVQERAAACLVDWARARAHVSRLRRPASLGRGATLKGRKVAACRQFSHSPCGIHPGSSTLAAGYRYSRLGENLYLGTWGRVSPRDAVAAWLRSPAHRANLLRPGFRHLGAALVRAHSLRAGGDSAVWVTQLATPR